MTEAQIEEKAILEKMPKYKSHKEVRAIKIRRIDPGARSAMLVPEDQAIPAIRVDHEYMRKHNPLVGGYYVVYEDGYKSWSPAEAFESGYTKIDECCMGAQIGDKPDFQSALRNLLNEYSMEGTSNTPDFILAKYLDGCLEVFDSAVRARNEFTGEVYPD